MGRPSAGQIVLAVAGIVLVTIAVILGLQGARAPQAPDAVSEIPRVSLAGARAAFDSGEAVFIDVRGADAYAASHIPGSLSIPLAEIGSSPPDVDPSTWIITYCT